jgi:molecular chaperone GrpE
VSEVEETPEESLEAEATPEAEEALEADLDSLLADMQRERDEYLELAQRARADFENYRRRAAAEAAEAERRGRAALAADVIPALDSIERALRAAGIDPDASDQGPGEGAPSEEVSARDALARGVELVYRELRAALNRSSVEAFDPAGEPFDPALHEALASRPADDAKPGSVVETVDKGYRLDGQILRAARVIVAE